MVSRSGGLGLTHFVAGLNPEASASPSPAPSCVASLGELRSGDPRVSVPVRVALGPAGLLPWPLLPFPQHERPLLHRSAALGLHVLRCNQFYGQTLLQLLFLACGTSSPMLAGRSHLLRNNLPGDITCPLSVGFLLFPYQLVGAFLTSDVCWKSSALRLKV